MGTATAKAEAETRQKVVVRRWGLVDFLVLTHSYRGQVGLMFG
jgi:hypothetical protein